MSRMMRIIVLVFASATCILCGECLLSEASGVSGVAIGSAVAQSAATPSTEDAYQQLDEVMRDPMFQRWQLRQKRSQNDGEKFEASWLDAIGTLIGDWIGRWFERWFDSQEPPSTKPPSLFESLGVMMTALKVIGVVLIGALLVFFAYTVFKLLREAERRPAKHILSRQQVREALETGEALAMESDQWLQEVDRLVAERDMRVAFRALYLSLLSGLHSARRIDFRRNRTNWVYVHRFRGGEDDRQDFGQLTRMFDDAWYGLDTTGLPPIENLKRQITRLLAGEEPHA